MSRPFTFEDDVLLVAAYAMRERCDRIAARLGRTESSVKDRYARLQRKARIRNRSLTGSAEA